MNSWNIVNCDVKQQYSNKQSSTAYLVRVDYEDSLGRSRRCLKKDLPELIKRDKQLTNQFIGLGER